MAKKELGRYRVVGRPKDKNKKTFFLVQDSQRNRLTVAVFMAEDDSIRVGNQLSAADQGMIQNEILDAIDTGELVLEESK